MGMSVVPPLMIMIAALGFFNFFGMMIMMFVPMVMRTLFVPMIVRMCIILLFHIGGGILVVMVFVPMVVSALLMSMIMCMSVVVVVITVLELSYFRFEIGDV